MNNLDTWDALYVSRDSITIHTFSLRSVLRAVTFASKRASRIATAFCLQCFAERDPGRRAEGKVGWSHVLCVATMQRSQRIVAPLCLGAVVFTIIRDEEVRSLVLR